MAECHHLTIVKLSDLS